MVCYDRVLFNGEKLMIPKSLQGEVVRQIHQGHLRVQSCLKRARRLVLWIGMTNEITDCVLICGICQHKSKSKPREPILKRPIPELPFEQVSTDLFNKDKDYVGSAD
jgi:hypothetical protein